MRKTNRRTDRQTIVIKVRSHVCDIPSFQYNNGTNKVLVTLIRANYDRRHCSRDILFFELKTTFQKVVTLFSVMKFETPYLWIGAVVIKRNIFFVFLDQFVCMNVGETVFCISKEACFSHFVQKVMHTYGIKLHVVALLQ